MNKQKIKKIKFTNKQIKSPKFLHKVFGENPLIVDLIIILSVALISLIIVADDKSLEALLTSFQFTTLQILAFDITGGVIANFTKSTSKYYNKNNKLRLQYLGLHILQPALLYYIFPNELMLIVTVSVYTLLTSLIVNNIKDFDRQRVFAVLFLIFGLGILITIKTEIEILFWLLLMYMLKLIIGFSVRYVKSIK